MSGILERLRIFNHAKQKAANLLLALVGKHYPNALPGFQPADTLAGLIDQIDNVTSKLALPGPVGAPRAHLIGISKSGRTLTFTFVRQDDVFTIETYGTLADDIAGWKKQAGLES